MCSTRHEVSEKRTGRSLSLAFTAGSWVYQLSFEHSGCAERGEMLWWEETGMEVQTSGLAGWPHKSCRNILLPSYKSRMQTSSEDAVGRDQQCLFVTVKETQHPGEVLSGMVRRGAPWPGVTQLLWAQSREMWGGGETGVSRGAKAKWRHSNDLFGSQNALFPERSSSLKVLNFHDA